MFRIRKCFEVAAELEKMSLEYHIVVGLQSSITEA